MPEPVELTRAVQKLSVIDLGNRSTELLKIGGQRGYEDTFILRDTQHTFGDNKATVCNVWLTKTELLKLADRIEEMVEVPRVAEDEPERMNGISRAPDSRFDASRYPSRCDIPRQRVGNGTLHAGKL